VVTAGVTISVEVSESHPETPEVEFTPDVPGEWIASQSQTVVSHPDEHISLVRKHMEWARDLEERIKSAKQADKSTFLRRAEQQRLTRIRFVLGEYIDAIEEYISVKQEFEERIDGVVNDVETVESEAAPYLGYEQYLTQSVETTLRRDLRSAKQAIREFRDEINLEKADRHGYGSGASSWRVYYSGRPVSQGLQSEICTKGTATVSAPIHRDWR
jgi:hypothetical protein